MNNKQKRFHTPAYRQKVQTARAYKRPKAPADPERAKSIRRWLRAVGVFAVLALIVYVIYFLPLLQIRDITIEGADAQTTALAGNAFNGFLHSYRHGLPQKNILFFSKAAFTADLAAQPQISAVQSVKKHFWHGIDVTLVQRVPAYVVQSGSNQYLVANDGTVESQLQSGDVPPSGLMPITDDSGESFSPPSAFLPPKETAFIATIQSGMQNAIGLVPTGYEIAKSSSTYLTVYAGQNFRVLFDDSLDPSVYLSRLQTIWNQFAPQQRTGLAYIDLRFDPNAYTCYQNQPCAAQPAPPMPPAPQAATTPAPNGSSAAPTGETQLPPGLSGQ